MLRPLLDRLDQSVGLRITVYLCTALLFLGGLWVTFSRDRADFIINDARHDRQIEEMRDLANANALAIQNLINIQNNERQLQSLRNDAFRERDVDHEERLRRIERHN